MYSKDSLTLANSILNTVCRIGKYLTTYLYDKEGFGMRSFYGESFSLVLLSELGLLTPVLEKKLRHSFYAKDRYDSQYHWEFNNYAMMQYGELGDNPVFKNTPCTNWTLLRANVRIASGVNKRLGYDEATQKLKRMQKKSGLIMDDPGVKSFQYHCFSAAMIYEIYQVDKKDIFLNAFKQAVRFIRNFILPNGDALYVGRGQQQSFGYAVLIYILSAYYQITNDRTVINDMIVVFGYISSYVRDDGALPLVLGGGKEPLPHPEQPHKNPSYPGWYAYNNYFDYLPFSGYFLKKAANLLFNTKAADAIENTQRPYRDDDFLKLVAGETIAIVSRPGGYWSNDLPVPYVYSNGRARTPCYGGEQFGDGIYSMKGIPLPVFKNKNCFRWRAKSIFFGNTLVIVSPTGVLFRSFQISSNRLEMKNRLISPIKYRDRYLFSAELPNIMSTHELRPIGKEYSVNGELTVYEADRVGDLVMEFR